MTISEWSPTDCHRRHVLVSRELWAHFHKERHRIDREWRGGGMTVETLGVYPAVAAARDELRHQVEVLAPEFPGNYLVPV